MATPVISIARASRAEGTASSSNSLRYEITLSEAAQQTTTVSWSHHPGGTASEADMYYGSQTGTLTINVGQSTAFIEVLIRADAGAEPDESFVMDLYNAVGAVFAGGAERISEIGVILDDDGGAEKRALLVGPAELIEGDGSSKSMVFKVVLSRAAGSSLSFDYTTLPGTAQAGSDYTATSGTLVFAAGQTEALVSVPVLGDTVAEAEESFTLLVTPQGAAASAIANGVAGRAGIGLIGDNDTSAMLPEISVRDVAQTEGTTSSDSYLRYQIVLSEPPTSTVRVDWLHQPGGTGSEDDLYYGSQAGTVTFNAGQTTAYVAVLVRAETSVEVDESVTLQLYNASGAVFAGGTERTHATGIILDDDGTGEKRGLFVSAAEVIEGDSGSKLAVFKVMLSRPASSELVFDVRTLDGSAQAGSDYTATSGTLTFAPGQTVASVSVAVSGDTVLEGDESFSLLVTPQAASASAIANGAAGRAATGLIGDDDASATLPEISARALPQIETTTSSDSYLRYEIRLSEPPTSTVRVSWLHRPTGTASESDLYYGSQSGTVTFNAGQTTAYVAILNRADALIETDESVVLELYNAKDAVFAGGEQRLSVIGIILDDDGSSEQRSLFVSSAQLLEGDGGSREAQFRVTLSRPASSELVFDVRTLDGTAQAGSDYTATTRTLVFAAGQTEASVGVPILGDTTAETDESFTLLVSPQAGSVSAIANGVAGRAGVGVILDNDTSTTLPEVSVRGTFQTESTSASDSYLYYVLTLSEPPTSNVRVNWLHRPAGTASESDLYYGSQYGTVTFAAGETTALISILVRADALVESDESVVLELYNVSGAVFAGGAERLRTLGVIVDDDGTAEKRALFVSQAEVLEGDGGARMAVFKVALSRPAGGDLVFDVRTLDGTAQAGSDYTATTSTLVFAAGQTEASVSVPVLGDTTAEADESFTLLVTPQAGSVSAIANGVAGRAGAGLIVDNDTSATLPEISVRSGFQSEGTSSSDAYLYYTLTLSEPATSTVRVSWLHRPAGTAAESDLYYGSQSGTVTFALGETTATLSILLRADALVESDESLVLDLYNANGAVFAGGVDRLRAVGLIMDDDGTAEKRALFVSPAEVLEGDSGSRLAVFKVTLSRPASAEMVFDVRTIDGTALAGSDYTAVASTLVFAAGQTEASVSVPVLGDSGIETDESFTLLVTPQAGAAAAVANGVAGRAGIGLIRDNDTSASLPELSVRNAFQTEGTATSDGNLYYVLTLSEPATSVVRVSWLHHSAGTATDSDLYHGSQGGTATFAVGETTAVVATLLRADALVEPDESLVLELYNASGAVLAGGGDRLRAQGLILDDDGTAEKRALFVSPAEVIEGHSGSRLAVFKVTLSRPASSDLVFDVNTIDGTALAGSDYTATSGILSFAPGQSEASFSVPVLGDTVSETEESFTLLVTPQAGSASAIASGVAGRAAVGFIGDDDTSATLPEMSLRHAYQTEGTTTSDGVLRFQVTLSAPATDTVRASWAAVLGSATESDMYYGLQTGTLSISAGQTTAYIELLVRADSTPESDERIFLELFNPSGAVFAGGAERVRASGIIVDDDGTGAKLTLHLNDASIAEGDSGSKLMAFTVQLSRPSASELVFDYQTADGSALAGSDYTATAGRLTFAPGQTEAAIQVPILGDLTLESAETFSLVFAPTALVSNGATGLQATGTIRASDVAPVSIIVGSDAVLEEGQTFTRRVTISDGSDAATAGWTYRVSWSDGVVATGSVTPAQSGFDIVRTFTDDTKAPLEVTVTVTDEGTDFDVERFMVTVTNRTPTVTITGAATASEGTSYRLALAGSDAAGVNDPLIYTIDWGDGSALQALSATQLASLGGAVNRLFADAAGAHGTVVTRTVTVTVDDGDGGIAQRTLPVQVSNVVQTFTGTTGADTLPARVWGDLYDGGAGDDLIMPGDGYDTIDGGAGFDRVSYAEMAQPVVADLAAGSATIAGVPDLLAGVEALTGTSQADSLLGNAGINAFIGGGGNDTIDGRAGFDVVSYAGSTAVNVNLATGAALHGSDTDVLVSIEGVIGSSAADTLRGVDGPVKPGETFRGGGGNDSLFGGTGTDTAEFSGSLASYTITRTPGTMDIVVGHNGGGADGSDSLNSIEHLLFADRMVSFGPRAEDVARVAFALWTPAIYNSPMLFAKGMSFYDNEFGYSFDFLCQVALQYWTEAGAALASKLKNSIPAIAYSEAQLLQIMSDNGGGNSLTGRAAAVKAVALDPATTAQLDLMGVFTKGVVATHNFDAELYFSPIPG